MLEEYGEFCYDQVGGIALDYETQFETLRPKLTQANIDLSLPEYISVILVSAALAAIVSITVVNAVLLLVLGPTGIIAGLIATIVISGGTAASAFFYPSIVIKNRASKIRDMLPFATIYLSTLAGTGTPVAEMFRVLSERDEYGEVAEEAGRISRDLQTFNLDTTEALKRAAERSPSQDFRDLMYGMSHALNTGGELGEFLEQRSQSLMDGYERRIESFSDQLSLLVEMYITVVIVGSIIFTALSVIFSSFGILDSTSTIVIIQVMAIFIGLPVISGMFILLVNGIAPEGIR